MPMSKRTHVKIDATPEQVAQAIFAAATPPDPMKRKATKSRKRVTRLNVETKDDPLPPSGGD